MIIRVVLASILAAGALYGPRVAAEPQSAIHHCVATDGTPVYTDQPCADMDAVPAPTTATDPRDTPAVPVTTFCPTDRAMLKRRVAQAFNAGDANALAGLILWHGYGRARARHTLRRLARLVRRPFNGFVEATDPVPAMSGLPPLVPPGESREGPHRLMLDLDDPAGPRATFTIIERAGCLWLQP